MSTDWALITVNTVNNASRLLLSRSFGLCGWLTCLCSVTETAPNPRSASLFPDDQALWSCPFSRLSPCSPNRGWWHLWWYHSAAEASVPGVARSEKTNIFLTLFAAKHAGWNELFCWEFVVVVVDYEHSLKAGDGPETVLSILYVNSSFLRCNFQNWSVSKTDILSVSARQQLWHHCCHRLCMCKLSILFILLSFLLSDTCCNSTCIKCTRCLRCLQKGYTLILYCLFLAHPPYCQATGYPVFECGVRKKELSGGCFFVGAHCFCM